MWVEVVLLMVLLLLLKKALSKPQGLPPGWWGLPLIGHVPLSFKKTMEDHVLDLQKRHGNVNIWRIGTQVMVFIHDHQLIKEAFNKVEFTDRPDWIIFNLKEKPAIGLAGSNGLQWHNNRRFSLRQLRDMGMGKSKIVGAVQKQAKLLVEELKGQADKPAPIPHALNVTIVNVIFQMVTGLQFETSDPKLKEFQDLIDEILQGLTWSSVLDFLPWIRVLPESFVYWLCNLGLIDNFKDRLSIYFKEVIEEHRATLDRNNPRDVIDGYLMEMEEKKDEPDSTFHEKDLIFLILDLFITGMTTTGDTIKFISYYLAANPKVQRKLQAEIDEVLDGAPASMEDKARMPYTEAVIHEVLRMSSLASLGIQHMATQDTQFAGYTIPKGAIINGVGMSVHHDPRFWDDPHQFQPERWLDENGHFTTKKEGFLPFGVGKRQCIGEGLARMELFIFTTAMFQSLNIAPPPGKIVKVGADPIIPLFHTPYTQDVLFTVRE